ncbi:plexin-C1 [Boleophthalmus pectinirostris]|uniref:plexin-C1 n=1 Tax=Boleophthalmus pectinirostris TaxID=150288 RepID=UPI00242B49CF|nr:plexin-C1 [Boleophthalmus pectinirostris]
MLLLCALCALWSTVAHRTAGKAFSLDGDTRKLAVTREAVYVSTEKSLYHLRSDLSLVRRVSLRGWPLSSDPKFVRVPDGTAGNTTLKVNVLLPFTSNNTLVMCGAVDQCVHCEVLSLQDVSTVIHAESAALGPVSTHTESVAFLVTGGENNKYILAATEKSPRSMKNQCSIQEGIINLFNTNNRQIGDIFSFNLGKDFALRSKTDYVGFVDGFQVDSFIYVFSNLNSSTGKAVRLIWLNAQDSSREAILESLRGAFLNTSSSAGFGGKLLASSVIAGTTPLRWTGVFSVDGTRLNTELLLFDISPRYTSPPDMDKHFKVKDNNKDNLPEPETVRPQKTLLKQSHMSSVLALTHRVWKLFFIGTANGQLIKLVVDKNYQPACPKVLYRADDDGEVFPKLYVDEVNHKHIYAAFTNQIMQIAVSNCSIYTTLHDCWSAQDPQCVWCHSTKRCTFESDCQNSSWVSISEDFQEEEMVSFKAERNASGQITIRVQMHMSVGPSKPKNFACHFTRLCGPGPAPSYPQCICVLHDIRLPAQGVNMTVKMRMWNEERLENFSLRNCSEIRGLPSPALCRECIAAGCGWSSDSCSWANEKSTNKSICQKMESHMNYVKPEISSVSPNVVSFYGKNHVLLKGRNLSHVTRVRVHADLDCSPLESPVWNNTGESLTFRIPSSDNKGVVQVCAVLPDNSCHGNVKITYGSLPSCTDIKPSSSWLSGGRTITLFGSNIDFFDEVVHSHSPLKTLAARFSKQNISYTSPGAKNPLSSIVFLKVANHTLSCSRPVTYLPDPVFTTYTSTKIGGDATIIITKKADNLDIQLKELSVWAVVDGQKYPCLVNSSKTNKFSNNTDFICQIKNTPSTNFEYLMIQVGDSSVILKPKLDLMLILLVLLLIPCIVIAVVIVYKKKQNQLTNRMNSLMENLEMDIRNDIRQGFIELQTENDDLLENVSTIPFLDYKHFASRIFFPESEALMKSCVNDIHQDGVIVQLDECCQSLSKLIRDQFFLTSMVHTMEEQKNFSIKDKCVLASLLTVALHSDLTYLTEVMEVLLKDLMQQSSHTQPKLLLRRTESTVEKLLTNWMSICLYGFLREGVGQQLFLLVSALSQQISKGPVDCVTEKALYTLSEDWLLWQAQDFKPLKLKVLFAVGSDGEMSEPLEVAVLTCDTVDQVKDKILTTFRTKFGFPYNIPLRELCIEYVRGTASLHLEEVDLSSERLGDVTMLNTMKHYKIPDGATIKVLSRKTRASLSNQLSVKDDQDFSGKYFHLIDPDIVEDLKNPEKKKLKLKEVHLTKLLSTKVAVHSYVEKLFRCIWGLQYNRAPLAVKHFFDFLDAQAEDMKITDPDILHIWKTNSLPLRFWVNILKNPQFVFDLEKSPNLDGCLSVIAQAFMDSFSLSDTQLGKHTPTNKLLYAKEIPKYKQEVKVYYKQVQDQPSIPNSEFTAFLQKESKKHENEFNEAGALKELYKFIQRYFSEIQEKLEENGAPAELKEKLHHVKKLFDELKSCSWN